MKERPVIFSPHSVRQILAWNKTQTRRVVKWTLLSRSDGHKRRVWMESDVAEIATIVSLRQRDPMRQGLCPYGFPGSRLWVRETWLPATHGSYEAWPKDSRAPKSAYDAAIIHRADSTIDGKGLDEYAGHWRPSIFMPRWASRITLEITEVRVQRLQDISDEDCRAEGCESSGFLPKNCQEVLCELHHAEKLAYKNLWDSINAKRGFGWDTNPWCWCITFQRLEAK